MLVSISMNLSAKKVAFFFFNSPDTTIVEDEFVRLNVQYRYFPTRSNGKLKNEPTFWVQIVVTNKLDQPIYIDKGNSFVFENRMAYCMYEKTTTKGYGLDVEAKRILPIAPKSTAILWNYNLSVSPLFDYETSARWFIGIIPKNAKLGYQKEFKEDNSPLILKTYITYSLDEKMNEAKQLENSNFVTKLLVDKEPISFLKYKGKSKRFASITFSFMDNKYLKALPKEAFWYMPVDECY